MEINILTVANIYFSKQEKQKLKLIYDAYLY